MGIPYNLVWCYGSAVYNSVCHRTCAGNESLGLCVSSLPCRSFSCWGCGLWRKVLQLCKQKVRCGMKYSSRLNAHIMRSSQEQQRAKELWRKKIQNLSGAFMLVLRPVGISIRHIVLLHNCKLDIKEGFSP